MRILLVILILIAATESASACGPGPVSGQPWVRDKHAGKTSGQLPTPRATAELLHRPLIVKPGEAIGCDQFARFLIRIELDSGSKSKPSDYGYVFLVRSKDGPLTTLPDFPIQGKSVDGFVEFEVEAYDFGVGPRSAIDIEIEVRAVDRRLRRGPKSMLRLQAGRLDRLVTPKLLNGPERGQVHFVSRADINTDETQRAYE